MTVSTRSVMSPLKSVFDLVSDLLLDLGLGCEENVQTQHVIDGLGVCVVRGNWTAPVVIPVPTDRGGDRSARPPPSASEAISRTGHERTPF